VQFSVYTSCYAATGVSAFLFSWGMDTWLLRESASSKDLLALAGGVLRNKAVMGLMWGSLLVIGLPLLRPDIFSRMLLVVCVIDTWCDSCLNTQIACLNINKQYPAIPKLIMLSRFGRLVGAITLVLAGGISPFLFGLVRSFFSLAAFLLSWRYTHPRLRHLPAGIHIFRRSLPYAASDILAQIYVQADVTILALMSSKAVIGLYSTAEGIINALFIIPTTAFLLVVPTLSRLADHEPERFRPAIKKSFLGFLMLGLALISLTLFFGGLIAEALLGPQYRTSGQLLVLMSPILFMKALEFGCIAILVSAGRQSKRLVPQALSAATNVLLNIWMIPIAGIFGVALVYVFSEVILIAGYGSAVIAYLREKPAGRTV